MVIDVCSALTLFRSLFVTFFASVRGTIVQGGKNRRRGKSANEGDKVELTLKEDGQEYAQVVRMLGNGRLEGNCFDGKTRLCHIRGKVGGLVSCLPLCAFLMSSRGLL